MPKIHVQADCGNSPKNHFVKDLSIALATGDLEAVLAGVSDDIRWELVGDRRFDGQEALATAIEEERRNPTEELWVEHAATHGYVGAVDGRLRLQDGKTYGFCDVYDFTSARGKSVQAITSYRVPLGDAGG